MLDNSCLCPQHFYEINDRQLDRQLDYIYGEIDGAFRRGEFSAVNRLIMELEIESMNTNAIITLLTVTLAARSKLPARGDFFKKAEAKLKTQDGYSDDLLRGLEQ